VFTYACILLIRVAGLAVSGTRMPVHTADADGSLFQLITWLSVFPGDYYMADHVNIPTTVTCTRSSVHSSHVH